MFDLVADVESYPQFLPMCEELKVKSKRERDGKLLLIADMTVGYKLIRETFTSQVLLDRTALVIDTKYLDGPFKYLKNGWFFEAVHEGACNVHFHIDYEFKSKMLGMVMGSMFDIAFRKFSGAFEERANAVYGTGKASITG
jgi:coenzyme Q-binding protein COQ10